MEMPSVVHPNKVNINDFIFQVVAYVPMTDAQAAAVAMMYYRSHKLKKKDRGKLITVVTMLDEESIRLF